MKLTFIIIFITQTIFGQVAQDSISKWTKTFNILPLNKVDTTSKKIPNNISTQSGWHIDYYARPDIYNRINIVKCVYSDNYSVNDWYALTTNKFFNHGDIIYDSVKMFKESDAFLYIRETNAIDTSETILVFPKKPSDIFQFHNLLYADYDNNIFIEYSSSRCQASNILHLEITNISSGKIKEIKFSKGICESGKNNWCIDKITYQNGTLTIVATVTNKRTKKTVVETHRVEI